jgi:hypothetical protein
MKSVFRPLQALNLGKATLYVKKDVRCGMGVAQTKAYTEAENCYSLEHMMNREAPRSVQVTPI